MVVTFGARTGAQTKQDAVVDIWFPARHVCTRPLSTRRRRRLAAVLSVVFAMFVFPGLLGAAAVADSGGHTTGSSVGSSLEWTHLTDSSNVPLSSYLFATDHGGLLHPGNTAVSTVLGLEFAGWKILVITAIWLIGYTLSFRWLDIFAKALNGVAHSLSGQIATPMMLVTAAAIGAFCVAWFVVRGFHSKATVQVVTMLAVAVIGPFFLAEPLADVLSQDGLLAKGRDLGISVAAGLDGQPGADPDHMVASMQTTLADNFARRPLQVWNFGHIVDERAACRTAWSTAVSSGSEDRVKRGIAGCGDRAAHESVDNPSFEQVGTGLLLLISGTILLAFGAVLALKVLRAALDTVYHGLMSIFGFAAGGFIYGPTQTFLIRNLVDGFVAAARMTAFTIFLGVYVLILHDLFRLAGGQVTIVFLLGALVEIIAILQLRKLGAAFDRGNEWIANRFALTVQGQGGRAASSGGGHALGMGEMSAKHTVHTSLLPALAAVSTVSNSPVTEWLWGRTRSPLRPFSRTERAAQLAQWRFWGTPGVGGEFGSYAQSYMHRRLYTVAARRAAEAAGGVNTVRGAAAALQGLEDVGGKTSDAWAALTAAGFRDEDIKFNAIRSWSIVDGNADDWTLADKHLGHVVAAVQRAQDSSSRLIGGGGDPTEVAADLATLQAAAFRYQRANPAVTLDGGPGGAQHRFVTDYLNAPTEAKIQALQRLNNGDLSAATGTLTGMTQTEAARMMQWIGNEHAQRALTAVDAVLADPSEPELLRTARRVISDAANTDQWAAGSKRTPWNSLSPPRRNQPRARRRPEFAPVGSLLNS
ncbi:hypothetical protein [Nocardia spumae]|uniref:hypothetical protein n=1 Tax=Nocardia spumae TaxID=2887190 RepID=UPI001D15A579|nr:hypothetical protein [Nocardia spumae]